MTASQIVASTNRAKNSRVREVSGAFGTTPATPVWKEMFNATFGLKLLPKRGRSKDRRSDGQESSSFLLDLENSGSISTELKFKHYDDELESSVRGVWSNQPYIEVLTTDTEISDVSATTLTVSAGGANFKAGHVTRTLGLTTAANNKTARVSSSSATTIVYPGATFASEAAPIPVGANVRVVGFQGASGDIVAVTAGGNAWTSTALDFTTLGNGVASGHWLYVDPNNAVGNRFATAACNGWYRIAQGGVAANRLSFDIVPSGFVADAGTGKTIFAATGDFCKNGTTVYAYSFETQQLDITVPTYEYFNGDFINNTTLTLSGGKEIDVSFDYIGLGGASPATARFAGSTDVAAPAFTSMTATSNVGDLAEGGASLMGGANCMSDGSIKITNNITRTPVVGPLGSAAVNVGALMVSGTLNTYFGDGTILAKGPNDTLSSFSTFCGNASGDREGYRFDCPAIRLSPDSDLPGSNVGRKVAGPWEAEPHASLGYTISIGRFWLTRI